MIRTMLIVALGGGIGSALRYIVSRTVGEHTAGAFPLPTFAVNIAGCLLIGLLYGLSDRGSLGGNATKTLLTTGLCGGFTTFSTFCNEGVALMRDGSAPVAIIYAAASMAAGMAAVAAGCWLAAHIRM